MQVLLGVVKGERCRGVPKRFICCARIEQRGKGVEGAGARAAYQYFVHRLRWIAAKAQQVEVSKRNHDVIGLPSDPTAHVNVAVKSIIFVPKNSVCVSVPVGCAGASGVDGEADASETSSAVSC